MEDKQYLVSVVVPVFNAGKYLRRCVESLIYQTLDPIELIFVNKESTDDSLKILEEYQRQFPDKVFVYNIPYSNTPAAGRNYGIKMAKSEYIGFSDADDMLPYDAIESFYKCAVKNDYDIVISQFYDVFETHTEIGNQCKMPLSIDALIQHSNISFWNKMIKKSVLLEYGEIPNDSIFDDLPYIIPLMSKTPLKKIGYVARPLYYHINRSDSEAGSSQSARIIHAIKAAEETLKKTDLQYIDSAIYRIAKWFIYNIKVRWRFAQEFTEFLQRNSIIFANSARLKADKPAYNVLMSLLKKDVTCIPARIFISGFGKKVSSERISYLQNTAFNNPCEIVILDENNFDITENQVVYEAYCKGDYKFVNDYYAIYAIYKLGGIFVDDEIFFNNTLNIVRQYKSFFNFITDGYYSDKIFGAEANNKVFSALLETYKESFYSDKFYSLQNRIRNILTVRFAIPHFAQTNYHAYETTLFAPSVMVRDFSAIHESLDFNICYWEYTLNNGMKEIKSIQYMLDKYLNIYFTRYYSQATSRATNIVNVQNSGETSRQIYNAQKSELEKIKQSNAYLFAMKLRSFAKKPLGRILKKIYLLFHSPKKN